MCTFTKHVLRVTRIGGVIIETVLSSQRPKSYTYVAVCLINFRLIRDNISKQELAVIRAHI